jgi:Tol biopolymer transport system component
MVALLAAGPAAAAPQNGSVVFAGKLLGKPVIYVRDPALPGVRVVPTDGWAYWPAASPGGRRVAFTRRGGLGAQIWVAYTDGSGLFEVTSGPQDDEPRWSPTGDAVVFARGPAGSRDVYTVGVDGTGLRRVTYSAADDHSPSWSVTGRIAFVRGGQAGGDIYEIGARGGGMARRLTTGKSDAGGPAWSPTGRTLAFARGAPGRRNIYLLTVDGAHERRLTALPGDEGEPAWSPDGRWIAFTHRSNGSRRLYLLSLARKPVARLESRHLRLLSSSSAEPRSPQWQPTGLDPVVAAAGDVACDPASPHFANGEGDEAACRQRKTSDLLLRMDLSAVLALGDLQYEDGQLWKFQQSFDPTWGRLKPLIHPAPGNHEYQRDPAATGYFDYFNGPGQPTGPAGDRGRGYYSFDVGSWHLIALNSECGRIGGCAAGAAQEQWLRADLASHPNACTLAFWHNPYFSSGGHGAETDMGPVWNALYEANADVVLNGHEHFYERFAPQTPDGAGDPVRGIRQFTVGTGGKSRFGFLTAAANSEVQLNRPIGVLKLTLGIGGYAWEFTTAPNGQVADSGQTACH